MLGTSIKVLRQLCNVAVVANNTTLIQIDRRKTRFLEVQVLRTMAFRVRFVTRLFHSNYEYHS